jgi:Ca2+-binding EF-hand superfamily protein
MADKAVADERKEMLTMLFDALDYNGDESLDLDEFARFAFIMMGKKVSRKKLLAQLKRADGDDDGKIDREEWMKFGKVLNSLPLESFKKTIGGYVDRLNEMKYKAERVEGEAKK